MNRTTAITADDARRFRMALLRAKLTRLSIPFAPEADEDTLECQLRCAECWAQAQSERHRRHEESGQSMRMPSGGRGLAAVPDSTPGRRHNAPVTEGEQ